MPSNQLAHNGLVKLAEECGELIQVAMKKVNIGEEWYYYDGRWLDEELHEEIGDVIATIDFVIGKLRLNSRIIHERRLEKLKLYEEWDKK